MRLGRKVAIPCADCGRKLGGDETFNRHHFIAGDRWKCYTDEELIERGLYLDEWGVWHRSPMLGQASLLGPTETDRDPKETRDLRALRDESVARTREGIARADEHALEEWKRAADDAIETLCSLRDTITADDVWWMLEDRKVSPPREPRALGARMQAAAKRGLIVNTRRVVMSKRPVTHGSWVAEWEVVRAAVSA